MTDESPPPSFHLTRQALLRGLAFIYAVAFLIAAQQIPGLIGERGILPVAWFLDDVRGAIGSEAYWRAPSFFWLGSSDVALVTWAGLGLSLSLAAMLGFVNAPVFGALWALYLSFEEIGQVFWGFGWEMLLLEAGFLAIFLAPPWNVKLAPRDRPPVVVIWLFRWLTFRVMFGAGLIKIRGDACWRDLTCLMDHYETQPNPSPLSWFFHAMPPWFHKGGVLFNHFVELIAPWGLFAPRPVRHAAGAFIVVFQVILILSGNLSFLNWLTLVVALAAFDDRSLAEILPRRWRGALAGVFSAAGRGEPSGLRRFAVLGLATVVGALSLNPVANMLSPRQAMNRSFDPLHLVNTYGAFGSIEHERHEVVIEGTHDDALDAAARWQEYEFPCKPGDVMRAPCLITPYHYRLDWQMWFAGLSSLRSEPWLLRLVYELLHGNPTVARLLERNPFADAPPRYVRALYYRYSFAPDLKSGWWRRELLGEYFRPIGLDDADLHEFLRRRRWLPR